MKGLTLILTIVGILLGGMVRWFPGFVWGGLFGFLIGFLISLRGRVTGLESRLNLLERRVKQEHLEEARAREPQPEAAAQRPKFEPPPIPLEPAGAPGTSFFERKEPEEEDSVSAWKPPAPKEEGRETARTKELPPDPVDLFLNYIRTFFTTGNVVVKVGVIVLFFGVSFLLKFAIDRNAFPIELRLISVALAGLAMLVVGWRLRLNRPAYALIVQGGAIGILYMNVFAAAKLYHLVPAVLAFAVMCALVILSGALAVLQDSKALAVFGAAGGFLAPVLTSTGGGSHVMLFSYYAILNAGILGIAWFKAWRELNLVGFGFTFVIGAAWGHQYYRPEFFSTTEPFLILFFLFYAAISVLFAHRQPPELKGYVDGSLVFGVPLVAFALQNALVKNYEFGLALSALSASAFYILLARSLWNRKVQGMRMLTETFLALGVVFGSLAIPLALDGRWTAAAWALEGAALVWVGVRQNRWLARAFGLLLQIGAGVEFYSAVQKPAGDLPVLNGLYLGCLVIALAGLFSSYYLEHHKDGLRSWEEKIPVPMLVWGLLWWFGAGLMEIHRHVSVGHQIHSVLVFAGLSCGAMAWISRRLAWNSLRFPGLGLLPVMVFIALGIFPHLSYLRPIFGLGFFLELILLGVRETHAHPFVGWGIVAWTLAFSIQYLLLRVFEEDWKSEVLRIWHMMTLWLGVFLLSWEGAWVMDQFVGGSGTWKVIAWGAVPGLTVLGLLKWGQRIPWPVGRFLKTYLGNGLAPVIVFLWLWELTASFQTGDPRPLSYLPLINPLDLVQIFVLLVMAKWVRNATIPYLPPYVTPVALTAVGFVWLNALIARSVHFLGGVPFTLRALHHSILFQSAVSILWSLTALGIMVGSNRRGSREVWFTGAVLLGLVVAKLFLVDLSGIGTVARIVSFLVVGVLMLVIGFLSPLPPRRMEEVKG